MRVGINAIEQQKTFHLELFAAKVDRENGPLKAPPML